MLREDFEKCKYRSNKFLFGKNPENLKDTGKVYVATRGSEWKNC